MHIADITVLICLIGTGPELQHAQRQFHVQFNVFMPSKYQVRVPGPDDWTVEQWRSSSAPPGKDHCYVYNVSYSELAPGELVSNGERKSCSDLEGTRVGNVDFEELFISIWGTAVHS